MRRFTQVIVGISLITGSTALAQEPPQKAEPVARKRMPDGLVLGTVSLYSLMDNPRVQEELEISEQQSTKLADYQKDFQGRRQEFMKQVAAKQKEALSADDKEEFLRVNASRNEKFASFAAEADEFLVKKILDAKQVKRLKEIRIQAEGVGVIQTARSARSSGLDGRSNQGNQSTRV